MSHSSEHDHDFGHEDAHSKQIEETEALLEPAGFLNDLAFREEEDRTIHLTEFFPVSKAFAISHNRARVFSDMRQGKAKPLNFAQKRTLSTAKPNYKYHDILSSKHCSRGMLGYFQDASLLRLNPLSLVEPLGELPENALDIRKLEEIFLPKRADIYILPATFTIRFRRFRRKHKKAIFRISLGISLSSVLAISALVGGAFIAKNELEAGYQSLESLAKTKTFAEFEARSQEARSHFRIAKPLLAVLSTIFDTPVYRSEKIRSVNALGVG